MNSPKQTWFVRSLPWFWFGLALVVIILDQWTKWLTLTSLELYQTEVITSFFNFTHRYNYGVAFSLFDNIDGGQRWPLSALAFVVSVFLVFWIWRIGKKASFEVAGLALILGGALGNLYDRVVLGYVVDFIEVHYGGYYWPAFNIADAAICIGAGLILLEAFRPSSKSAKSKAGTS